MVESSFNIIKCTYLYSWNSFDLPNMEIFIVGIAPMPRRDEYQSFILSSSFEHIL
jgi:hypothetical protein